MDKRIVYKIDETHGHKEYAILDIKAIENSDLLGESNNGRTRTYKFSYNKIAVVTDFPDGKRVSIYKHYGTVFTPTNKDKSEEEKLKVLFRDIYDITRLIDRHRPEWAEKTGAFPLAVLGYIAFKEDKRAKLSEVYTATADIKPRKYVRAVISTLIDNGYITRKKIRKANYLILTEKGEEVTKYIRRW